jgi:Uncharacterised protein conserved in bacteria (DUF2336)
MRTSLRKLSGGRTSTDEDVRVSAVLERLRDGLVLLDDVVVELADAEEMLGVAGLIAERLGLEPEDVFRAITAPSEQLLTVLCRAAGLKINGFSAVLRMRCRTRGAMHSPAQALTAFHDMPIETARRMARIAKEE